MATATTDGYTGSTQAPDTAKLDRFTWPDYLVFGISLAMPLAIGIFFLFYKRKETSTEAFLMGDRSMNFVAVALSILASLLNGAFVIGVPAEIHYYGAAYSYFICGLLLVALIVAHVFVPTYQTMLFTSAYEYIEHRYNKPTRLLASAVFIISVVVFLAVVLYVPSLAFSQVTPLSLYVTIVMTGGICTLYTAIGGIRAVVWTDALQMIVLLVGLVAVAITGADKAGGGQHAWDTAKRDGRINFDSISADPRERTTFWTQLFGQGVTYLGLLISNQMMVQRYMTVSSVKKAQASLYVVIIMVIPLFALITFIGIALHATYATCDPIIMKQIKSPDQIFLHFVMDTLGTYHGIPGLITASIFAAALSSVASVINSLSAVFLEDFIDPAFMHFKQRKISDKYRRWVAIGIVVFFGLLTIGLSFAADKFTSKLSQAAGTIWGVLGGPLAGIFILGFFIPFSNSAGAIIGTIGGLIISLWMAVGSIMYSPQTRTLPIGRCSPFGNLTLTLPLPSNSSSPVPALIDFYNVSYGWYGVVGTGACIIIGMVASIVTGGCSTAYRRSIKPSLMYSCADKCCCCCPTSCIQCYRCGVRFGEEEEEIIPRHNDNKVHHADMILEENGKIQYTNGSANMYDAPLTEPNEQTPQLNGSAKTREENEIIQRPNGAHVNTGYDVGTGNDVGTVDNELTSPRF